MDDGSKIGTDSDHIGYRNVRNRNLSVPQLNAPKSGIKPNSDGTFGEEANWDAGGLAYEDGHKMQKLIGDWDSSMNVRHWHPRIRSLPLSPVPLLL